MRKVPYVFAVLLVTATVANAESDRDKALKLFEDSNKAYKSGEFERAAKLLHEAYALYPEPLLLYNLGRAQEGLADPRAAVESYERYLKDAKQIDDRGAIERRIETLKAQIQAQEDEASRRRADDEVRRQREQAERLELLRRQQADDEPPLAKWGPWITMGSGVAVIGTGLVFGFRAEAKHDDAIAAPGQRDAQDLQAGAERNATVANVLFIAGGAIAIGGVAWKLVQWRQSATTTAQVRVAPSSVAVEWTFP